MAHAYYALNRGQNEFDITYATSTQTKDVEVNVNLATISTKSEILLALDKIKDAITKDKDAIYG